MKTQLKLIFFIFILTLISFTEQGRIESVLEAENPLLAVTESTIKRYLAYNDKFFIFIHSPWCKWSQKFEAILLKINKHLRLEPQASYLGLIDQTVENFQQSFKEYISNGLLEATYNYPSLVYFENGERIETFSDRIHFDDVFLWIKRYC